ncbi:hypothetical protein T439DRAFT_357965 [Meredithblackwellia eburnea MCA 4105]
MKSLQQETNKGNLREVTLLEWVHRGLEKLPDGMKSSQIASESNLEEVGIEKSDEKHLYDVRGVSPQALHKMGELMKDKLVCIKGDVAEGIRAKHSSLETHTFTVPGWFRNSKREEHTGFVRCQIVPVISTQVESRTPQGAWIHHPKGTDEEECVWVTLRSVDTANPASRQPPAPSSDWNQRAEVNQALFPQFTRGGFI